MHIYEYISPFEYLVAANQTRISRTHNYSTKYSHENASTEYKALNYRVVQLVTS